MGGGSPREIEVEWVELRKTVRATLDETRNPELAELLWNNLPYASVQTHALVSGQHLYHIVPVPELVYTSARSKEDRTKSPDGTLFLSQLHHLAIKYGELTEYLPAAPVGYVRAADIPVLKEAGRACWESTYYNGAPIEVRVRRAGDATPAPYPLRRAGTLANPEAQAVLDAIHGETERIWLAPPAEIVDLHAGRIRSRAGSYGQYFNTLVFVNGEARPLGYGALGGLVRACRTTEIDLATLIAITPGFVKTPAEFLGYCGLDTLWDLTQRVLRVLPLLHHKTEYYHLIAALGLYAERVNTWALHYFPWRTGERFKLPLE